MHKYQQMIKIFFVLFIGTAFIFSFSHYGAKAFNKISGANGEFSEGTTIGALDISGKNEDEATSLLKEKYVEWLKAVSIKLQYGEKTAPFDINKFHLDAQQTIDSLKDGQQNKAFITLDETLVEEQLEILFPQIKTSDYDIGKLTTALNTTARQFDSSSQTLDLNNDFILAGRINKDAVVNTAVVKIKDVPFELQETIDENSQIEIHEGSTFSMLEFAKKQKIVDAYILNVLATGIYQAILPTNFSIVERNISNSLPNYSNLGFEAKVNSSKNVDLVLVNPNKAKYIIKLYLEDHKLKVILKGEKFAYDYQISTHDKQRLTPKTIIQYSPLLLPGKTKVQTKGEEGQIIKVYRDISQGDQLIKSELISEDYYPPTYQVEIHGLAGSTKAGTQTTSSTGNHTDNSNQPSETTNTDETSTISDNAQNDTNESDLWGKPNEQLK